MRVQAEVSLYPLGEADPLPGILEFVERLEGSGLEVEPGPMSTLVTGESGELFAALGRAWEGSAREGRRQVLVVKVMNGKN